jgi:hypothetical protein
LVAQAFEKVPALKPLAPTQSEPPFLISQVVLLVIFIGLIIAAAIKFHPDGAIQGSSAAAIPTTTS